MKLFAGRSSRCFGTMPRLFAAFSMSRTSLSPHPGDPGFAKALVESLVGRGREAAIHFEGAIDCGGSPGFKFLAAISANPSAAETGARWNTLMAKMTS